MSARVLDEPPFVIDSSSPLHRSLLRSTEVIARAAALAADEPATIDVEYDGDKFEVSAYGGPDEGADLVSVTVGEVDILPLMSATAIRALSNATVGALRKENERDRADAWLDRRYA